MANYRFKTAEIETMKKNILTHIAHETETKTAWRLRCAIEGQLMCCRPSKREAARLERELALYEKLTKNDLPDWQTEPTQTTQAAETPLQSTQAAETVNVSPEAAKTDRETENMPKKERMKSYARITGQFHRLWLAANGNKARQDRITAIWHRYTANISKHFKNPFMSEWDAHGTDELPRSIYAATDAPHSPEAPQEAQSLIDTSKRAQIA